MRIIVFPLAKNQQMRKAFSKPHLGAFFAEQKTGLSGAPSPPIPCAGTTSAGLIHRADPSCNCGLIGVRRRVFYLVSRPGPPLFR
jgi:hypothetical protein